SAEPGEILMGPTACGLAGGVVTEPLGERFLKGFPGGFEVRRVVCAQRPTGRPLNVVGPYVGREEELELLENAFARAVRDRRAQLVTIFGEPGIGRAGSPASSSPASSGRPCSPGGRCPSARASPTGRL